MAVGVRVGTSEPRGVRLCLGAFCGVFLLLAPAGFLFLASDPVQVNPGCVGLPPSKRHPLKSREAPAGP